jgi:transcriptional regulator with XRE-family HTH domain
MGSGMALLGETAPSATEPNAQLGIRIKHLRRSHGLRLKDVAAEAGCSESMLSKIENGQSSPSINMLHRITKVLGTSIGQLFHELASGSFHVLRNGARPAVNDQGPRRGPGITVESLTPFTIRGLLQGQLHVVEVGGGSDGSIQHDGEEVGYVIEGKVELRVDEQVVVLAAGDSFFFDSSRPHGYRNVGETVARIVWVNSPPTY